MKLIEQYLQYLNEQNTALARRIRSGKLKLSPEKIKELIDKGMIKPWEHYKKGMETGYKKILSKHGYKSHETSLLNPETGLTIGHPNFKHVIIGKRPEPIKKILGKSRGDIDLTKRHEASEVSNIERIGKKYNIDPEYRAGTTLVGKKIGITNKNARTQHASPRVLRGEKEFISYTNPIYKKGQETENIRRKTGEYNWLEKTSRRKQNKQFAKTSGPKVSKKIEELINRIEYLTRQFLYNPNYYGPEKVKNMKEEVKRLQKELDSMKHEVNIT